MTNSKLDATFHGPKKAPPKGAQRIAAVLAGVVVACILTLLVSFVALVVYKTWAAIL